MHTYLHAGNKRASTGCEWKQVGVKQQKTTDRLTERNGSNNPSGFSKDVKAIHFNLLIYLLTYP